MDNVPTMVKHSMATPHRRLWDILTNSRNWDFETNATTQARAHAEKTNFSMVDRNIAVKLRLIRALTPDEPSSGGPWLILRRLKGEFRWSELRETGFTLGETRFPASGAGWEPALTADSGFRGGKTEVRLKWF